MIKWYYSEKTSKIGKWPLSAITINYSRIFKFFVIAYNLCCSSSWLLWLKTLSLHQILFISVWSGLPLLVMRLSSIFTMGEAIFSKDFCNFYSFMSWLLLWSGILLNISIFTKVYDNWSQFSGLRCLLFWLAIYLKLVFSLMMMVKMTNCFCGMVDRRKAFRLDSSRGHCPRSSPSRISDTPQAGFEPAKNLSSGLVKWSCAVVINKLHLLHYLVGSDIRGWYPQLKVKKDVENGRPEKSFYFCLYYLVTL